ncbi:MAG: hypothetical protein SVG88_00360 [Halobacteriales archaeon]|nr:hypothetical protein [Halobacteriales archaeon]
MPDQSSDHRITILLLVVAWSFLFYTRRDFSQGQFRLGLVTLGLITAGFIISQARNYRSK